MRRRLAPSFLLALSALAGCNRSDEPSDAERLAGLWIAIEVAGEGAATAFNPSRDYLALLLTEQGAYELTATSAPGPAERLQGSWRITAVEDARGDRTDAFREGVSESVLIFREGGTCSILIDFAAGDPRVDMSASCSYTVDERGSTLGLAVRGAGSEETLLVAFTLAFTGEEGSTLSLSASSTDAFNRLLGTSYVGLIGLTLQRRDSSDPAAAPRGLSRHGTYELEGAERTLVFMGVLPDGPLAARYAFPQEEDLLQLDVLAAEVERINGAFSRSFRGLLKITLQRYRPEGNGP